MKYICLVYHEEKALENVSDQELDGIMTECDAWLDELRQDGQHVFSAALQCVNTGSTLRFREGRLTMTDGPFAETKEVLAGFTILEARDLNEAINLASKLPSVRHGSVEVRPVLNGEAQLSEPLDRKIAASVKRTNHQLA